MLVRNKTRIKIKLIALSIRSVVPMLFFMSVILIVDEQIFDYEVREINESML